jgi:hypothetical protein
MLELRNKLLSDYDQRCLKFLAWYGNVCYEGLNEVRLCLCDVLCRSFGGTFYLHFPCIKVLVCLEDGGNIFIQNICIGLENYITSHP